MTINFITLRNASRSNLEAFFDGLTATQGVAPTLMFDTSGLSFSNGVTDAVSLQMSLASALLGPGHSLTLSIDGVSLRSDVTPDGASLTLLPGVLTGSIVFDGRTLASFTLGNADTDVLTVSQDVNGMPGLGLKLDSLLSRIVDGTDDALLLGGLSASDAVALASVVFRAAVADKTPAELLDWVRGLVTLPAELDTVGELAQFVQQVFTQPGIASLTFSDLQALANSGAFGEGSSTPLLLAALSLLADISPTMNLSQVLATLQDRPGLADLPVSQMVVAAGGLAGLLAQGDPLQTVAGLMAELVTASANVDTVGELAAYLQDNVNALQLASLTVGQLMSRIPADQPAHGFLQAALGMVGIAPGAYATTTMSQALVAISANPTLSGMTLESLQSLLGAGFNLTSLLLDFASATIVYLADSRNIDTLGELIDLVRDLVTAPSLSGKPWSQLVALAAQTSQGELAVQMLDGLATLGGVSDTDSLATALDKVLAAFPAGDISLASLQSLLGAFATPTQPLTMSGLFDDLVGGVFHLLELSGLSVGDLFELLISSVEDSAALSSALGAIDLTPLGLEQGWLVGILEQIRSSGSVDLADLLPIAVKTFLAYDGSATFSISDAAGLGIKSDGKLIDSASVTVPLGDADEQQSALVYDYANRAPEAQAAVAEVQEGTTASGQVVATDPDAGDLLSFALVDPDHAPVGLTFNADGSWSFDASSYGGLAQGEQLVFAVAYTATDAGGLSASSTLSITVNGVDDVTTVSGMVYHWKTHALLSDVNVALETVTPQGETTVQGAGYELRHVSVDALGQVKAELWVKADVGIPNLDLVLGFAPQAKASLELSLQGWTTTVNDQQPGSMLLAGIKATGTQTGEFQLGTLTLKLPVNESQTALQVSGNLGGVSVQGYEAMLGYDLTVLADATTGADGNYVVSGQQGGLLAVQASKPLGTGETGSVINSADALAALKLAVGRGLYADPDGDGPLQAQAVSPYQFIAADANEDGKVTSADALEILKMAVHRSDAIPREWLFVSESADFWDEGANDNQGAFTIDHNHVAWENEGVLVDGQEELNLVAVLKGDVNGSWAAPAGSQFVADSHFADLVGLSIGTWEQWGIAT